MAVDREIVVRSLFGADGEVPVGATARVQWIWSDSIRQLPFDTAPPRWLLDARGWRPGPDGVRAGHGVPLRFTLLRAHDEPRAQRRGGPRPGPAHGASAWTCGSCRWSSP